jgi:hypothetical protein
MQVGLFKARARTMLDRLPSSLQASSNHMGRAPALQPTQWQLRQRSTGHVHYGCMMAFTSAIKLYVLSSLQELHIEHAAWAERLTLPPSLTRLACGSQTTVMAAQLHPMLRVRCCCHGG